jgi:4-diphosphocytidyl-2-C-methyl-D-erythritol kinase
MKDLPPGGLRLAAPAKLNFSLSVTGRRLDGRHELAGVMVLLELADELLLQPGAAGFRVEGNRTGSVPASPSENLAWRGLVAGFENEPQICLALTKRVPAAAGLGGGSSDAAAAWRLGRRLRVAPQHASATDLVDLADIGADVPFFAAQTAAARVTGIGERVAPLDLPTGAPREVVLAHPPFGLSTAAVFAELRRDEWTGGSDRAPSNPTIPGANDLLPVARRLRPEIANLERLIVAAGAEPHMTGSGPTFYALIDDPGHADAIASRLQRGGVRTTRTRLRDQAASIEPVEIGQEVAG